MTTALSPGTVLGGRYHLDVLLDDVEGARFWRATDVVLARSVAVHVLPEDDPRTDPLLAAARASATVADPHLLRVLDADVRDGLAWVINEWGQGRSLDIMVSQRPLPPDRAAWLAREVASAIAVAHGAGLTHGRLAPENVMVTESGTAKIIGFGIDACIQRQYLRSGHYPECTEREADVVDLAGILYAGLVGSWPGASGSRVRAAPRDADGPLRPRQVRAGVPGPLDLICSRVLGRSHPGRSAHQVAAVLTEYLGELCSPDPAAISAPTDPTGDLATVAWDPDPDEPGRLDQPDVPDEPEEPEEEAVTAETPFPIPDVEPPADLTEDDEPWQEESQLDDEAPEDPATELEPQTDTETAEDLEATQQARLDPEEAAALDPDWAVPSGETTPPPPEPEPVPERPLFAPDGARRTPRADLPTSATARWGSDETATTPAAAGARRSRGASSGWPFDHDPEQQLADDYEERTRRHWLRLPLAFLVLAAVVVGVAVWLGVGDKMRTALPGADPSPTAVPAVQASGVLKVRAVNDLDPFGVPPEENPDQVKAIIDGDPNTAWQTQTYRSRPDLGGLKPGVGVVLDLGSVQQLGSVTVALQGAPTSLDLYTAPTAARRPTGIEGLSKVASAGNAGERVVLRPDRRVRTRYVVVWLTSLPAADGGYRGGISGVVVRS